ncbi:MAG: HupE/UreJ family protein [Halioglobus sp.]
MKKLLFILVLLSAQLLPHLAIADPQSKSFSHWSIEDRSAAGTFTIALRELTVLTPPADSRALPDIWREHLAKNVVVSDENSCLLIRSTTIPSAQGYARAKLEWQCQQPVTALKISVDIMFDHVASHVHFANYHLGTGNRRENLFTASQRNHQLWLSMTPDNKVQDSGPVLATYLRFGFEHILIGLDHVAFLLTLLLLPGSWKTRLWVITGFTLGHSVTLSLSALGQVTPDIDFTEALIGLSIALVAIENITAGSSSRKLAAITVAGILAVLGAMSLITGPHLPLPAMLGLSLFCYCYLQLSSSVERAIRMRPVITSLFGLIHGFGFASVLMEVGLPASSNIKALLGFNLGVELGQIFIVAVFLGLGAVTSKTLKGRDSFPRDLLSASLCSLGVYWFLQRLYF